MWSQLFQFCSSDESLHLWQYLLKQIGYDYEPILCQFVTKTVTESLIKSFFPTVALTTSATESLSLDDEESNALRYSTGYVLRAVTKKVKRSANPFKQQLLQCLNEMAEEAGNYNSKVYY